MDKASQGKYSARSNIHFTSATKMLYYYAVSWEESIHGATRETGIKYIAPSFPIMHSIFIKAPYSSFSWFIDCSPYFSKADSMMAYFVSPLNR